MSANVTDAVLAQWGLEGAVELPDAVCGGSPNRVIRRTAIQKDGDVYVLEALPPEKAAVRLRQAGFLSMLMKNGCGRLNPWLKTASGLYGTNYGGLFWQLRRYAHGSHELPDGYSGESWRGIALADFLLEMRRKSSRMDGGEPFLLSEYIPRALHTIGHRNAALREDLLPIVSELAEFLEVEANLPMSFCHGDFHPQNVIWGDGCINAVIDWEFCGVKTAMYDVANLLGCIGMDCPENFSGGLATAFLRELHNADSFSRESWRWLPDCMAATRIAWMREWCFMDNRELMVQELDYLWLLLDNRETLRRKFDS